MNVLEETRWMLESLCGVWAEDAVDELSHALQSAARAVDDGADDELVLASALHDLGRSPAIERAPGQTHDRLACEWLTPRFGTRVGWLAGAHVAAKRYLVATEPTYRSALSRGSVMSLARQGGAGVDEAYTSHEWWQDGVRLRRYDDAAKVPDGDQLTVDDVMAVAQRVLRRRSIS